VNSLLSDRHVAAYNPPTPNDAQRRQEKTMDTEAIALMVDEPITGHFYWVLQKQDGLDCRPIDAAAGPMPTYGAAMMAGIDALQRRADSRGPNVHGVPIVTAYVDPEEAIGPPTIH
jgi:hypothetical protein